MGGARNLLDFIDARLSPEGDVLVAFADGCLEGCTRADQSRSAEATLARLVGWRARAG